MFVLHVIFHIQYPVVFDVWSSILDVFWDGEYTEATTLFMNMITVHTALLNKDFIV